MDCRSCDNLLAVDVCSAAPDILKSSAEVEQSTQPQTFPVKLTDPFTAILYVTNDKKHIEELKHTIHVHEINEAPPHEQHVLSLHRHGHYLGGLPTSFWLAITFLVVVFHLFLFKLVYNEYCGRTTIDTESAAASKRSAAATMLAIATATSERFRVSTDKATVFKQ
ncbi:unnamed protein product [Notodromas monacha]|uniref:Uncharacterized protein n=1 Tax=Notodromas monacha TaxID=399045 RepID=A0A7R9BKM2_9CRUS|nr:unnamed protein product [Notodromas monacha]CAG0915911.1 unnamed protein product [Notodromas monacha]